MHGPTVKATDSCPNKEELNDMYSNIGQGAAGGNVGGFANDGYWSSSENGYGSAWNQNFFSGYQNDGRKGLMNRVRAVRAF